MKGFGLDPDQINADERTRIERERLAADAETRS